MKFNLLIIVFFLCGSVFSQSFSSIGKGGEAIAGPHRLNKAETELSLLINSYRSQHNLKPVPVSSSLSKVARLHVHDLSIHYRYGGKCNLHSWSRDPRWSSCCYTSDHRKASCMWDKPRELTRYTGDGYEIAFYSNADYPAAEGLLHEALEGWKSSRGHHDLIINRGKWATAEWKAMGVGVYEGFVVVWFGELTDPEGSPERYSVE